MPKLLRTWQQAAQTLGGELDYADERNDKGRSERLELRATHRHWPIAFAARTVERSGQKPDAYTRVRCAVRNPDRFRFSLYEERIKDRLFKFMGLQDIIVGDPAIDKRFIIQATHKDRIQALFHLASVRAAFASPYVAHLRLIDDEDNAANPLPPGTDLLYGRSAKRMHDLPEILAHFQLFTATLDGLLELGYIEA
jgi:hypothetical protein